MSLVLSTDSVPAGERRAYWHDAVWRTFVPLDVSTPKDPADAPFSGAVRTDRLGHLQISTVDADPERVFRTPRLIARDSAEYMLIGLQGYGPAVITQDGRDALLRPGDFAFYDTTRPYTLNFPDRFQMKVFQLPRQALGLRDSDLRRITGITLRGDEGPAALVAPFLAGLAAGATSCRPPVGDMLARNAVDLLTTLIAEHLGRDTADTDAAHRALLVRIRAFIDHHLADPGLSPESIAAAHRISVRYLHRLFQDEGPTVSRWIQHRRLEECRRELSRPGRMSPTVSAVAHRWGFANPAHFSRVFRAAYGMSPREWQGRSGGA
ncbi:helix-turn-helix domain-containing protein [Streptomyces hokutonensis]|uniref:Helix-turn-helix domain-containing protein n=1 Tax=Streptomyces hokutonensis TaxID=1306990 RepID=A0ABW6MES4_9ACTN